METKTGARLLVDTLEKLGCTTLFGIPGIHNLDAYDALLSSGIHHVTCRNESGAGFMADGYGRTTGLPGVALVITGPGLTNIATAMGEAFHDSVPMLVISSQVPRGVEGQRQGFLHELQNSRIMAQSVAKESRTVGNAALIPEYVEHAYRLAHSGRPGPVHIEIPLDVLRQYVDPGRDMSEALSRAAQLLTDSSSTLIIAGGGASGVSDEVRLLAEKLQAPVLETASGKGVLPADHALSLGARLHLPVMKEALKSADTVLGLGTQLSPTDLWEQPLELSGKLIQINVDPGDFERNYRADLGITAALSDALPALRKLSTGKKTLPQSLQPASLLEGATAQVASTVGLEPRHVSFITSMLAAVRAALPRDGVLAADMTTPAYVALSEYPAYSPRTFLHPVGFGTLGFALPAAIGALAAAPGRAVCVLTGDGGFQFTMQELGVAVQEELPLPVVIWNDAGFGEIRRVQESRHPGRHIGVDNRNPSFDGLAQAYGIPYHSAATPQELQHAVTHALSGTAPVIIEVTVS